MTEEERPQSDLESAMADALGEAPPAPEPVTEPDQPTPETVTIRIALLVETNEKLKSLAALWGQTKTVTAWKLLTGAIQHHYSINKNMRRL